MFSYMTVWPIEKETGYEPKTTYWNDFETAEMFGGEREIRALYKRAMRNWKDNVEYITEICMVLNWRLHLWYQREGENSKLARLYDELWRDCDAWCFDNLKGDDLQYYIRTTR